MYARVLQSKSQDRGQWFDKNEPLNQRTSFEMFFKNPIAFKRQYLQVVIKMVQLFEEIRAKAKQLKTVLDKVFLNSAAYKYIDAEQVVLGFFYFYVYKDFILRELLFYFS